MSQGQTNPAPPSADSARPAGAWGLWLGVAAIMLVLYAATTQHGWAWQDSGIFQWRILNFDLTGRLGLALAHPLLILLGKAMSWLPLGAPAFQINLLSALCGAIACANVAALVRRLAPDRPAAAWVAGGMFGLAHTPWWLSTICESQMLFAALLTVNLHVLVSLVRRPTPALALVLGAVNGLGLLAHNLALLALAVYGLTLLALCFRGRLRWTGLALLAVGWLVGASALLAMTARLAGQIGPGAAVRSALFGNNWQSDVLGGSSRAVRMGAMYIAYNFPNAAIPLALAGLWALGRGASRPLRWPLLGLAGIYLLFAIRYTVMDQFMFFVPFYALLAVLAGIGLGSLGRRWFDRILPVAMATVVLGPVLYAAMPAIVRAADLPTPGRKDLPFRDPARYWYTPWKGGEDSAGLFARAALSEVPPDATIIADGTARYPLLLTQRVEGVGPNVEIVESPKPQGLRGEPNVFAVSRLRGYYPQWLDESARLGRPPGKVLYRVEWNATPATATAEAEVSEEPREGRPGE